ncbi:MAG: riboflavin synthase [Actinomycetota bacterium]|nr:riboflavin synthase [Actinomycetota bacterium]MDH5223991.1 riboflavin synthase [Actinomycetota bacterium]MDH5314275.1 riboflavin synthase [Actinomycetota bacterium]
MFTGIVEELGTVASFRDHRLEIDCGVVTDDSEIGASVAVNGVCLTVVSRLSGGLAFDLSDETIARTSLRRLAAGATVNLERPVTLAARLGGHLVQGHVDGVGDVTDVQADGAGGARIRVGLPEQLRRYTIEKGSITVDGVSLTVAELDGDGVTIALIPHTLATTTLGTVTPGDPVNLEVDMIAKYVQRLLAAPLQEQPGTMSADEGARR